MNVLSRPMELRDVQQYTQHIAAHPILGPRYGRLIEQVPSAVRFGLANETSAFYVFEGPRYLGAAMAVFVSDGFVHEAKTTPMWIVPELVNRIASGRSPILSLAEFREANSTTGVNMLGWHVTFHPGEFYVENVPVAMTVFDRVMRGLKLKEVVGQANCLEHYHAMRYSGGLYFDRAQGAYVNYPELNAQNFADEPRTCGLTRELAAKQPTSWLGSFFASYEPPHLGFAPCEQRLLRMALNGETDWQLADRMKISLHSVKKLWRSIYGRADLAGQGTRGEGKKRQILAYVRKHPEELHPYSQKLLASKQSA